MSKGRRWTAEEDRVLTDQVTRNAHNLAEAFRKAARLTDRSYDACKQRWYYVLCKETTVCYATIGYKTRNVNRKVVSQKTSDNTEKTTVSWWKKFLSLLKK